VVFGTGRSRIGVAPCGRPILGMENGRAQTGRVTIPNSEILYFSECRISNTE
jgi:hypothetical protein